MLQFILASGLALLFARCEQSGVNNGTTDGGNNLGTVSLGVSSTALHFGNVTVGSSATQTVTLTNTGTTAASLTIGTPAAPFSHAGSGTCGAALAAGGSCTLIVKMAPSATGLTSSSATVTYSGGASSAQSTTIAMDGTGANGAVLTLLSGATLHFGLKPTGSSTSLWVSLINSSAVSASGLSLTASGAPFTLGTNNCATTLGAATSCTFQVTFAPTSPTPVGSPATGTVTATFNDGNMPQTLTLNVDGAATATPHYYVYAPSTAGIFGFGLANPAGGVLSALNGGAAYSAGAGTFTQVAIDPTGSYLYAANSSDSKIYVYAITSGSGTLTPISGSPFAGAFATPLGGLAMHPSGKALYVYNNNNGAPAVQVYAINSSTGAVTAGSASGATNGGLSNPAFVTIEPTGRFLYYVDGNGNSTTTMSARVINSDYSLSPASANGSSPTALGIGQTVVDPSGRFLYVGSGAVCGASCNVYQFAISSDGSLGAATSSKVSTSYYFTSTAMDPLGRFVLMSSSSITGQLGFFPITIPTGALGAMVSNTGPAASYGVAIDPSGKSAFASAGNNLNSYTVNAATGAVSYVNSYAAAANRNPLAVITP
jgi:6-phosphogluconolactonase (cycloisomerase 2 family)